MRSLRFVTKTDCPLCDDGLEAVKRVARWLRYDVTVVYLGDDPGLATYAERVPVVLAHDEVVLEGSIGLGSAVTTLLRRRLSRL